MLASTLVLRPYQADAIEESRSHLRAGRRRPLIVAPTGAGKTAIASEIIRRLTERGSKVVFLAHRLELIDNPSRRLDAMGINHGVIMANHWRNRPWLPVQVASVATLRNREYPWRPDVLFIDEAHRARASTYQTVIDMAGGDPVVIGLTATPCRMDGRGLGGDLFNALIECPQTSELIDMGYLVPIRIFSWENPELDACGIRGSDLNQEQQEASLNKPSLIGDAIQEWRKRASDRTTVLFAAGTKHSMATAEAFRAAGIRAAHVDGTTAPSVRRKMTEDLERGVLQVLCNYMVLPEGWDCPPVSAVVLLRRTLSLSLYLQMVGRGTRVHLGKQDCLVLDHGGNFHVHGHAAAHRDWSLDADRRRRKAEAAEAKDDYKVCPECMSVAALDVLRCPCGYAFSIKTTKKREEQPTAKSGALVDVDLLPPASALDDSRRNWYWTFLHHQHTATKKNGAPCATNYALIRYVQKFRDRPHPDWRREWARENPEIVASYRDRRRNATA